MTMFFAPYNRKLLKEIDNKNVDIRDVIKDAITKGQLGISEWKTMDISRARTWLTLHEVSYADFSDEQT